MVNNSQDDSDSYSPSNSSSQSSSSSASCATSLSASFSSDSETSTNNVSKQASKQDGNGVKTSSSEKGSTNPILEKEHIDHILELHKKCPPLHKPGDKESKATATQEKIDYFFKAFMLKRDKFHKILGCRDIPKVLKTVPFALSYQSFVLSYWPGPLQCCNKTFGSTRFFCKHLYDCHLPPSAPPSLACFASGMGSQAAPNTPSSNPPGDQTTPEKSLPPPQAKSTPVENENAIEKNSSVSADEVKGSPLKDQTKLLPPTSTGKGIKDWFDKRIDQASTKKETKSPGPKQNTRPSTSSAGPDVTSSNSTLSASRRRPLSPSAKPSPMSVKLQRLNSGSPRKNRELAGLSDCNGLHSASDTSMDADTDTDQTSGTARTRARPKRMCTSKRDLNDSLDLGVDSQVMDELMKDQKIYQPQHEPGQSENFLANESRLKYFTEVLKLKLNKYGQLVTQRPRSPSHRIPLALPLGGFIRFYWPGKMNCCGQVHKNSVSLEGHISRQHKPPRSFPEFLLVSEDDDDEDGTESDATNCPLPADCPSVGKHSMEVTTPNRTASSAEKKGKYPNGFLDDQNNFLPQHKIGDPEDFLANKESISYFMDVYNLKMEKYAHMTSSRKKPLGGTFSFFSQLYWPGMVNCCGVVCNSVGTFQSHFIKCHAPPSRTAPILSVLTSPPKRSLPEVVRTTPRGSTVSRSIISPTGPSNSLAVPDGGNKSEDCSTPVRQLRNIEEEIRQIRRQMADATSLNKVLQLLEEVLLNAVNVFERMKSVTDRSDRCMCVECLDSAWCVSKTGIVRWRDLKNPNDEFLNPVQYVYTTAPVFINWDSPDHLAQMENIMRLAYTAVRHVKSALSHKQEVSPVLNSKSDVTDTTEKRATPKVQLMDSISKVVETVPKIDTVPESSSNDKKGSHMSVKEFCERVNVALSQNTNARRDTGFKDDKGFYHPIYRYNNISLMIKLYAPGSMTNLRCCNRVFSLQGIRTHVNKVHEGPNAKYPISLAPA